MPYPACYAHIFSRLEKLKETAPHKWEARCPAHEDKRPSLGLRIGNKGNLLVRCHRSNGQGCPTAEIMRVLDCTLEDLWPDNKHYTGKGGRPQGIDGRRIENIYPYRDESGKVLFEVVRYRLKDGSKEFRQRQVNPHPDPSGRNRWLWHLDGVRRVLYRLPELLDALAEDPQRRVAVVEGEKAADALWGLGVPATTNPAGAGKWSLCDYQALTDANVAVSPDNDPWDPKQKKFVGLDHAETVCRELLPIARGLKMIRLPGLPLKGDAFDWVQNNPCPVLEKARLFWEIVAATPDWVLPDQPHPLFARCQSLAKKRIYITPKEWIDDLYSRLEVLDEMESITLNRHRAVLAAADLIGSVLAGAATFLDQDYRPVENSDALPTSPAASPEEPPAQAPAPGEENPF